MSGNPNWQPIETAPKDGTWVLLWLPEISGKQQARWIKSQWMDLWSGKYWSNEYGNGPASNRYYEDGDYRTDEDITRVRPSHWMDISPP